MLRCHYCGYAEREVTECPSCQSEHIRHFGTGTQRVEEELSKIFPGYSGHPDGCGYDDGERVLMKNG